MDGPRRSVRIEPDFGIIFFRFRCRQEDQFRVLAQPRLRKPNEFPTNTPVLIPLIYGEVGQVAAILEVREGAGHTNQLLSIPGGANQIRVVEHRSHTFRVVDRPAFGQRGTPQQIDKFVRGNRAANFVLDVHASANVSESRLHAMRLFTGDRR